MIASSGLRATAISISPRPSASCPLRILARPRPSRARGLPDSSAMAFSKAVTAPVMSTRASAAKPKHRVRPRFVRGERHRALGCVLRPIGIAKRQPELGKPRPGACVTGLILDRLQQLVACRLELEVRLQRIRQRDPRRGRGGAPLDGFPPVGERVGSIVERDGDDRAQGVRLAVIGIARQRLLEIGARLVQAPGIQQQRRPPHVESRIALRFGNLARAARRNPPRESADSTAPTARHLAAARRRVAPGRGLRWRLQTRCRPESVSPDGLVSADASFEDRDERAIGLDADEELRALDRGVDKRRADVERPRLAREEENRAL